MKSQQYKSLIPGLGVLLLLLAFHVNGHSQSSKTADGSGELSPSQTFDRLAGNALQAMKARAEVLKIQGVALVAFIEGDTVTSWSSKMIVVGRLKNEPSGNNTGANLLGIAYTKAAEMADTLQDSGSGVRPPMKGEFGWQGGLIQRCKTGYLLAAFSGGPSEDDLKVARVGLALLAERF